MSYAKELKLKAVMAAKSNQYSDAELVTMFPACRSTIRLWVKAYDLNGEQGLEPPKEIKRYSGKFKQQVVEDFIDSNTTQSAIAKKHKISRRQVYDWLNIYYENGVEALYLDRKSFLERKKADLPSNENTDTAALLKELERLKAENAYLKKLNALVQEKQKSAQKKGLK